MSDFFGRKALLQRIHDLHRSSQHVSIVGARNIGKTALLQAVVAQHAKGSDLFAGARMVDFRHDPPTSTEAALRRVGGALVEIFKSAAAGDLKSLADEINLRGSAEELYDHLKIAIDLVAEGGRSVLLVLDGCDPVLQNSAIPRNLWDNLRALAQATSLRLMTGSRDHLHRLCYNPDARTSDFFRIFYDEPLIVGPFDDADWKDLHAACGVKLDSSAQKELLNWTGGHPDLIDALLTRVRELARNGSASKSEVDDAAEGLTARASGRVDTLWMDCPEESRNDIEQLTRGEMSSADMPAGRARYLVERGIATESGRRVRLTNRFVERAIITRKSDIIGTRKLFERPEDFATNIRTVLELRIAQLQGGDGELMRLLRRAVNHLPDEPDAALGSARDILGRALDLVWKVEAPEGVVPVAWLDAWKSMFVSAATKAVERYSREPDLFGQDPGTLCDLLRIATGRQGMKQVTVKTSKTAYVLIEHMKQLGDWRNHSRAMPSVTMAAAFCLSGIELCEVLARELR